MQLPTIIVCGLLAGCFAILVIVGLVQLYYIASRVACSKQECTTQTVFLSLITLGSIGNQLPLVNFQNFLNRNSNSNLVRAVFFATAPVADVDYFFEDDVTSVMTIISNIPRVIYISAFTLVLLFW